VLGALWLREAGADEVIERAVTEGRRQAAGSQLGHVLELAARHYARAGGPAARRRPRRGDASRLDVRGAGRPRARSRAPALEHLREQQAMLDRLGIDDVDRSPIPDLVEIFVRLGDHAPAHGLTGPYVAAATAKGQPWSGARAARCIGLLADHDAFDQPFQRALTLHAQTADVFERARTQLRCPPAPRPPADRRPRAAPREPGDVRCTGRDPMGRAGLSRACRDRRDGAPA
jgi:hypothetical protein